MTARIGTREHVEGSIARRGLLTGDVHNHRAVVDDRAASGSRNGFDGWQRISDGLRCPTCDAVTNAFAPSPLNPQSATSLTTETDPGSGSTTRPAGADCLTRRERQVLQLVVAGYSDREIAEFLCIGARTAEWHLANVFNKLGMNSRAAVAAFAVRHGLA